MKVRGVQTQTNCNDGIKTSSKNILKSLFKSCGCTSDAYFAPLPMHYAQEIKLVRILYS